MANWSDEEIRLTVADYFDMLEAELQGKAYNKTEHRKILIERLQDRTTGAVERKHQNISAVLHENGFRFIKGYKPLSHTQGILEELVLSEAEQREIPFDDEGFLAESYQSHSWVVMPDRIAVKSLDKSTFLHHGTGVPKEVTSFFTRDVSELPTDIALVYEEHEYEAKLTKDPLGRVRLLWRQNFSSVLSRLFPEIQEFFSKNKKLPGSAPELVFSKSKPDEVNKYSVEFVQPDRVAVDGEYPDELEPPEARREGQSRKTTTTTYERDPQNRLTAIRIHGARCGVCGFDFGKTYGQWGSGFIEVHHLAPLGVVDEEHEVNPETDLLPVCANCHRMLHRKRGEVLGINELRKMMDRLNVR